MSSCTAHLPNLPHYFPFQPSQLQQRQTQRYNAHDNAQTYLPTPQSGTGPSIDHASFDVTTFGSKHQYQQSRPNQQYSLCMNEQAQPVATTHPDIRIQSSSPLPPAGYNGRQDSVYSGAAPDGLDWQQQGLYDMSMTTQFPTSRPLKRARSHQRTPSASTVGSNGPASPYTNTAYQPSIANTDYSPNSPVHFADQAAFSKPLHIPQQPVTDAALWNTGYYIPTPTSNAHLAVKTFANDYHNTEDYADFYNPSMSSHGNNTPTTPASAGTDMDPRAYGANMDYKPMNGNPSLFRTESSQAYQDELYQPSVAYSSVPATNKRNSGYLSPHRNLVTERLQTADAARSASPRSAVSRERSPFRAGSPLAPTADWNHSPVETAANMRQQQKQAAEQAELEAHQPALRREATKTISPKDALLDYNESEQQPLFQDSVPAGYKQHNGGMETWNPNFAGSTFGNMSAFPATQQPQMSGFRATSADQDYQYDAGLLPPTSQAQGQISSAPYQAPTFAAPKVNLPDTNPTFPATLTSMESSVSDNVPPLSSQESFSTPAAPPKRPDDTRANTGTYTCTYHGCTQRFGSFAELTKHKRESHRAVSQQLRESASPGGEEDASASPSASARSSTSPEPTSEGMTSAALLARNSQAGPHKCTRINPSTNKPCNTIFSRPYDLTRHEDTIHNNRKQKVRCSMCREEKTFSRNDALTRHMRVVHPEVESFAKRGGRS